MKRLLKSMGFALNGLLLFFSKEKNGQLQLTAAIGIIILGFVMHISPAEWVAVLLCIALVIGLEMLNSAVEKIIDLLHPQLHQKVKWIKDVAAGAVLLAAIIAAIIGGIIFIPKWMN